MAVSPSLSCSSNTGNESVLSSSSIYSSEFSDGESVCTGEPLPYQFEPEPSPEFEGDDIPVDVPTEVPDDSGHMDRVGNVDW